MDFTELQSKAQNIAESAYKVKNVKALKASIILLAQTYADCKPEEQKKETVPKIDKEYSYEDPRHWEWIFDRNDRLD